MDEGRLVIGGELWQWIASLPSGREDDSGVTTCGYLGLLEASFRQVTWVPESGASLE